MKHRVAGRKLGRTSAHRLAVLRNLSTELFLHERIRTTLMKAKELRPFAERLITMGRRGDVHARRRVARHIHDSEIARKLVETIATRFAERPGGYTRILKLGPRRGDSAEMAILELIGSEPTLAPKEEKPERKGIGGRLRERFRRRKDRGEETPVAGGGRDADDEADEGETAEEAERAATKPGKAGGRTKASKGRSAKGGGGKSAAAGAKGRAGGSGTKKTKSAPGRRKGGQTPKKGR